MHEWSTADLDLIRDLWVEGKSMGFIAARLGVSRGAIAGKISKLRLPKRGRATAEDTEARQKKRASDKAYQARKAAEARAERAKKKPKKEKAPPKPKKEKPAPLPILPPEPPPTIEELDIPPLMTYAEARKHRDCQFIGEIDYMGAVRRGDNVFCGRPVSNSSVYCSTHLRLCYRPKGQKRDGSPFKPNTNQWEWNR